MKRTKPQPCERSRPRYAPTANRPAVTATRPIVCPNSARAWSRATAGWTDVSKELTDPTLQLAARDLAALDARDLLRRERRVGPLLGQLEHPEQVHDVVHPLVEVRPVARAAVVRGRRDGLESRQQFDQLWLGRLRELRRVDVGQVSVEQQDASRERQDHQVRGDRLAG